MNEENTAKKQEEREGEEIYTASQWQLVWRKLKKHRLAMISGTIIIMLYLIAIFAPFFSNNDPNKFDRGSIFLPPQRIRFFDQNNNFHFRPFVYKIEQEMDEITYQTTFTENKERRYPIYFLREGFQYKLFGLLSTNLHLFGNEEVNIFFMGTDKFGRCVFSKIIYGARISLSIGLIGILLSFILGLLLGGLSGYYGGVVDEIIQRVIEILRSFPTIPLWMALAAALPDGWSPIAIYFSIVCILSLVGWTTIARRVRGKFLSLREEDFTKAAKLSGAKQLYIIRKHFIPSFMSFIIASLTLRIPQMILAETALSFLGIGLRPPIISWGVLLQEAQNITSIALRPWLFLPAFFIIITVLAFNFLGDGLRDAADPYSNL